jgi:CheY-like chemotaxis protein
MLKTEIVTKKGPLPIPTLERKRQVLVVNDNKAAREALSRMLVSFGHTVSSASNGFDGGALFFTRSYDLAIIDLEIHQMNPWELSRIFKERSPKTPVILVTASSKDKHRENSGGNYADAILPKPFKLTEIEKIVQMLLNSGM